ncbi:periplasmic heavy metal sensor [Devosia sp.]|jgi:uncharacterized membrane protein|uniref:periplasmic heavy metal sensor n=1 Tax=Devosia sp. TaxID=1871048 RepID=UPI0037BF908D
MNRNSLLTVGIFVSLLLNVFLVAYVGTMLARAPQMAMVADATPVDVGNRIADNLPSEAGTRLRGKLRDVGPEILRQVREYRRTLASAAELLRAEEVDKPALKQLVTQARDARAEIGNMLTDSFVETAASLPPEERRKLIRRFRLQ